MVNLINKSKVKFNFNKAAKNYDKYASLQKIVANKLVQLSKNYISKAGNIIDLGSGSGFITQHISHKPKTIIQLDIAYDMLKLSQFNRKQSNIFNVNADIEQLPFKDNSFDLVISSLALQWINNFNDSILKISQIIKKDGILAFSIIADESLKELKLSAKNCQVDLSINDFIKSEEIENFISSNFQIINSKSELITMEYNDVYDILKSIKTIGASYTNQKQTSILTKGDFDKINNFYLKNFYNNNKICASWKVSYIICKI